MSTTIHDLLFVLMVTAVTGILWGVMILIFTAIFRALLHDD